MNETTIDNVSIILEDILASDFDALSRDEIKNLNFDKIEIALNYLIDNPKLSSTQKADFIANSWKIYYKTKPPTPEEFMTEEWIGPLADHIYPRVKKTFLDFMNPKQPYRSLILYPSVGYGKSYTTMFASLYMDTHVALMRNAKKYLGLNPASPIARAFLSFSIDKVSETLLEPFILALENSPKYEKVHTKDVMIKRERDQILSGGKADKIYWTTASPTSAISIANATQIKIVSSLHKLLGLNLIGGGVTELTHFRDAGWSDDAIMDLYWELKNRVQVRTMKGNYWGRIILDSSPDDISGAVDQYINGSAKEDPTNMIVRGASWEWGPENHDMEHLFPVYKGGAGRPPKVIEQNEVNKYDVSQIIWVPEDLRTSFKNNPIKSMRDLAGMPSGSQSRLFIDYEALEKSFTTKLKNIYTFILASTRDDADGLIWKQVKDLLFINNGIKTQFYYKPYLARTIAIDSSISGDVTGIACTHIEKSAKTGETMFIVDFTIPIIPDGGRISLDSVKFFIEDLRDKGNMNIETVSFDSFQSENAIQYLEMKGFKVQRQSVDKTTEPYYFLYSMIESDRVRVGQNIFLKNNLKSLKIVKRDKTGTPKVDHENGVIPDPHGNAEWSTSIIGINAKDVSDAVTASVYTANSTLAVYGPRDTWYEEQAAELTSEEVIAKGNDFIKSLGLKVVS